jgi:hypothetical protein
MPQQQREQGQGQVRVSGTATATGTATGTRTGFGDRKSEIGHRESVIELRRSVFGNGDSVPVPVPVAVPVAVPEARSPMAEIRSAIAEYRACRCSRSCCCRGNPISDIRHPISEIRARPCSRTCYRSCSCCSARSPTREKAGWSFTFLLFEFHLSPSWEK